MANPAFEKIEKIIQSKPVAIFMKGTPESPMCGFSARAIEVLKAAGVTKDKLASCDVLSDEAIRSGIKEFSNWPTIPQIYVNGEFIGGSDLVAEMYANGELQTLLETKH